MARPLSPDAFREECGRRLIETHDLMLALGLKSKPGVRHRVNAGTLPPPVVVIESTVSLWDRDALDLPDKKEATG